MRMWDDRNGTQDWYSGTVTKVLRQQKGVAGEYEVTFDDGDAGSLLSQELRAEFPTSSTRPLGKRFILGSRVLLRSQLGVDCSLGVDLAKRYPFVL